MLKPLPIFVIPVHDARMDGKVYTYCVDPVETVQMIVESFYPDDPKVQMVVLTKRHVPTTNPLARGRQTTHPEGFFLDPDKTLIQNKVGKGDMLALRFLPKGHEEWTNTITSDTEEGYVMRLQHPHIFHTGACQQFDPNSRWTSIISVEDMSWTSHQSFTIPILLPYKHQQQEDHSHLLRFDTLVYWTMPLHTIVERHVDPHFLEVTTMYTITTDYTGKKLIRPLWNLATNESRTLLNTHVQEGDILLLGIANEQIDQWDNWAPINAVSVESRHGKKIPRISPEQMIRSLRKCAIFVRKTAKGDTKQTFRYTMSIAPSHRISDMNIKDHRQSYISRYMEARTA